MKSCHNFNAAMSQFKRIKFFFGTWPEGRNIGHEFSYSMTVLVRPLFFQTWTLRTQSKCYENWTKRGNHAKMKVQRMWTWDGYICVCAFQWHCLRGLHLLSLHIYIQTRLFNHLVRFQSKYLSMKGSCLVFIHGQVLNVLVSIIMLLKRLSLQ